MKNLDQLSQADRIPYIMISFSFYKRHMLPENPGIAPPKPINLKLPYD